MLDERKPLRSKLVKCERKSFCELVFLFCVTFPHHFYDAVLNRRRVFFFHRSLSHFQSLFTSSLFAIHKIFLSLVDGRSCGYLYLFYLNCLCLRRARERAEEKSGELRRKANDLSRNNKQEKRFLRIMGNCGRSSLLADCTSFCCRGCHLRCRSGQKISMKERTSLKIGKHLHPRQQTCSHGISTWSEPSQSRLDSTMVNIGFVFSTSNKKFFISLRKFGSRLDVRDDGGGKERGRQLDELETDDVIHVMFVPILLSTCMYLMLMRFQPNSN